MEKLAEGKTKIVYSSNSPTEVILQFKDDITALDGEKHDILTGKGRMNAEITALLFTKLNQAGVPTHFLEMSDEVTMRVRRLTMLPIEVVLRNIAAGHFLVRLPYFTRGEKLRIPIVEFFLKDDAHHDPLLTEDHVVLMQHANEEEIAYMKRLTHKVNETLMPFFAKRGLTLVDFKIEFGRDSEGNLRIGDELNADSMRLWDTATGTIFDKDVYREGANLNQVSKVYEDVYKRLLTEVAA